TLAQAVAPVTFGGVSDYVFGGGRSGLQWTFALMLLPLGGGGFFFYRARRPYPTDTATPPPPPPAAETRAGRPAPRAPSAGDSVGERLRRGHERHTQRWHLHVPREGESASQLRPLLVLLGLPTFGLALAISVLTTYGPVILIHVVGSPTAVGALIGGEGAFALVVPLAAGTLSDRLPRPPLGRRLPFVLLGAPLPAGRRAGLPVN